MENLAIITVTLLFLAIPGYIARLAYFSGDMTRAVLPRKPFEDIYTAIIFSVILHAAGILICETGYHFLGLVPDIDFLKVYRLSTGSFYECGEIKDEECVRVHDSLNWVVEHTYQHGPWVISYFVMVIFLGFATGKGLSKFVWIKKLDLKKPNLFQFENVWLYRHKGRGYLDKEDIGDNEIIITFVDALVYIDGEEKRYSGLWMTFTTDQTGGLRDLVLLLFNIEALEERNMDILEALGTSLFVLPYSYVINLQISYVASNLHSMSYRPLQAYWD